MSVSLIFELHQTSTLIMVGIIWMVQVVHYPLMAYVGEDRFSEYSEKNQRWTTWVVIGPMFVEVTTGILLLIRSSQLRSELLFTSSLGVLAAIWLSTALLQVPIHTGFLKSHSVSQVRRLVQTNWIRTIGWTTRAVQLGILSEFGASVF